MGYLPEGSQGSSLFLTTMVQLVKEPDIPDILNMPFMCFCGDILEKLVKSGPKSELHPTNIEIGRTKNKPRKVTFALDKGYESRKQGVSRNNTIVASIDREELARIKWKNLSSGMDSVYRFFCSREARLEKE